jgi:uncharacterized protein YndB with AHSA1/START domain
MTERFVYVTYIRTTPEKLWAALTEPEFTRKYWAGTHQESDWRVGSSWKSFAPDGRLCDAGEIVEHDRPRRLVLTWCNEIFPDLKAEGFTRLTYELQVVDDAVKLTLTHESPVKDSKMIDAVREGWPLYLNSLKSLLETGRPLEASTEWPENI